MRKLYFSLASVLFSFLLHAQQATSTGSGSGTAGNITLDWSIGEMTLVSTEKRESFVLTQGVLQGQLTAVPPFGGGINDGELIIFPNPTSGLLLLRTAFYEQGQLTFRVYDALGKLLIQQTDPIANFGTYPVNLSPFAAGVYMLHATFTNTSGETRTKTFKIIKVS